MSLNVDSNGVLQPLGLKWIRDNRFELIPGLRKYTEEIPGRDGAISFGANLRPRILTATVGRKVSMDALSDDYRATVFDQIAAQLNPLNGEQVLTFFDEPEKVYKVELSDVVDIPRGRGYIEFDLSFEVLDPYKIGAVQKTLTGSGAATNSGTVATPFTLTIQGSVTDPSVTVGGYTISYVGTIGSGSTLVVDTGKMTAVLDGANALPNYNGVFPKLQPGDNEVTAAAAGITTLNWYDRWL
ncbi:MAG: phage tail family protein [Firmicutes bacterium]|nr:phage tail family protein [Bacillota bacterium]